MPLAYLGTIAIIRTGKERERLKMILAWLGGILLICFGFSALEQQLEFRLRVLPVLIQITRGFRYVVPLLEVLVLWPFGDLVGRCLLKTGFENYAAVDSRGRGYPYPGILRIPLPNHLRVPRTGFTFRNRSNAS